MSNKKQGPAQLLSQYAKKIPYDCFLLAHIGNCDITVFELLLRYNRVPVCVGTRGSIIVVHYNSHAPYSYYNELALFFRSLSKLRNELLELGCVTLFECSGEIRQDLKYLDKKDYNQLFL